VKTAHAYSNAAVHRIAAGGEHEEIDDVLAVEEPLEIRLGFRENGSLSHRAVSITMRTPGHDDELSVGFLFTEGIIRSLGQISGIKHCGTAGKNVDAGRFDASSNTIRVDLALGVDIDLKRLERHFYTTSSCGVCGKTSIEALKTGAEKLPSDGITIDRDVIRALPQTLRASQDVFDRTGGLHASAIFNADGSLETVREDVGRHNALDKVIGHYLLKGGLAIHDKILLVSGRASFELVQKALMARIPVLTAVGAPSSLAVELAREFGMTLIGFIRDDRFNIYCGAARIEK
jgi:FdhD protein